MAKRKKKDPPAVVSLPVEATPQQPTQPPQGEYHTITSLAALCNVTEQTVRRWLWYEMIVRPSRYGRLLYWQKEVAEGIARNYLQYGALALNTPAPAPGGKA